MKKLLILIAMLLGSVSALAMPAYDVCKGLPTKAVNEKVQKSDENSGVVAEKFIGRLDDAAFATDLLNPFAAYYVTTSDESGGCVYHVLANEAKACAIEKITELTCF